MDKDLMEQAVAETLGEDMSLQEKAIKIHGNDYVLVADRIKFFNETFPDGYIQSELKSEPDAELVVVQAKVVPDKAMPHRYFTGLSQAKWGDGKVNTSSALENAETSAVGRALGMMGIGVIDSVASADEMKKAGVAANYMSDGLTSICPEHHVEMTQAYSQKKKKNYWYHREKDSICFGKGWQQIKERGD